MLTDLYKRLCGFDSVREVSCYYDMGFVLRGRVLLIDLCMWTRNGARTLPVVLDRIGLACCVQS